MSEKAKHYKIFVNGAGYDATGYGITPTFFSLEEPNGETMFFPWGSIENIRLPKIWAELAQKHQAEEQRRQNPKIEVPRGPVLPFKPDEAPN